MTRRVLLLLAIALAMTGALVAYLPPVPEGPLDFNVNPCDGSITAAFESPGPDGSDPYNTASCRSPARRQLVVAVLLVGAAIGVLVVRARRGQRSTAQSDPN